MQEWKSGCNPFVSKSVVNTQYDYPSARFIMQEKRCTITQSASQTQSGAFHHDSCNPLSVYIPFLPLPPSHARPFFLFSTPLLRVAFLSTIKGGRWNREFSSFPNLLLLYLGVESVSIRSCNERWARRLHVAIKGVRREIDL